MTDDELKAWLEKNMGKLEQDLAQLSGLDADLDSISNGNPILHGPQDELSLRRSLNEIQAENSDDE